MDFAEFKQLVHRQFGLNLDGYKEKQIKRRIESLMAVQQVGEYAAYWQLLLKDPEQRSRFMDRITINVSEFFRNPEIFEQLSSKIQSLLQLLPRLKIWSAACANGAEPYSVAIILDELGQSGRYRLEATDLDEKILDVARQARYHPNAVRNVSPQRLQKYFTCEDGMYRLKNELQRQVDFRSHDLLTDRFETGYDLIICRNVAIYFTSETQETMYRKFHQVLNPGGVLFVGATETILQYREIGFNKVSPWFYQKNTKPACGR